MKFTLAAILLAMPFLCFSQYTYKNLSVNFLESKTDAANYTYDNLRLYPIYAKQTFKTEFKSLGKYTTLQQAIAANKVRITEKSGSGTVNTLSIENVSQDTIIVIVGEVIKGGKQDRIINKDMILAPLSGKKDLSVYCVESGRWSDGPSFHKTTRNAPAEFKQYHSKGSMSLRKVVEKEKDQGKVWAKVEEINTNNKTITSTKTYTAITSSTDYNKKLDKYITFFQNKFISQPDVIGVIIVSGDKVLGTDMFASHELFMQQYESLLHSYATEAILNGKPVTASRATVKSYIDKLLASETMQNETLNEKGNSFTNKGKKLRVSSFD
jgi:hypothetical protein